MLYESAHPGTATGLVMENVTDLLNISQYTPRDLILAAWEVKENQDCGFQLPRIEGIRVDLLYYGIGNLLFFLSKVFSIFNNSLLMSSSFLTSVGWRQVPIQMHYLQQTIRLGKGSKEAP